MKHLEIINTKIADLDFIYFLFEEAIECQKRNNYPVWNGYDKDTLMNDIKNEFQFKIVIDNQIACIFSICYSDRIIWKERDEEDAVYLHRVVVNPKFKGRKLFGEILKWVQNLAHKKGLHSIRMDTWADNPVIIKYYQGFDFEIVDYYTTPSSQELPIPQRNNYVVLLQYRLY